MPKLHSSRHVVNVLQAHGFFYVSQRGSHVKLRKFGEPTRTVIVPANHTEIPHGTLSSIMRQSGLHKESFCVKVKKK